MLILARVVVREKRLPGQAPLIKFHLVDAVVYATWLVEQGDDLNGSFQMVPDGAGTATSKESVWNGPAGAGEGEEGQVVP
jgi:hypothetical protein